MDACTISTFQRYEIKYLLTPDQYQALVPILQEHMSSDVYGNYTVSNIFFDTETFDITRASVEKPLYKEKLRLRAYGAADSAADLVFVELKKKYMHKVYKRRIALSLSEAMAFLLEGQLPLSAPQQTTAEIACFMDRYRPAPRVFIGYTRTAMAGLEDPELRVTFDRDLRWRDTDLTLCAGTWGEPMLPDGRILMEIKIPEIMPFWLAHALSSLNIFSTSFSKIGRCYTDFILPQKLSKKAVNQYV